MGSTSEALTNAEVVAVITRVDDIQELSQIGFEAMVVDWWDVAGAVIFFVAGLVLVRLSRRSDRRSGVDVSSTSYPVSDYLLVGSGFSLAYIASRLAGEMLPRSIHDASDITLLIIIVGVCWLAYRRINRRVDPTT